MLCLGYERYHALCMYSLLDAGSVKLDPHLEHISLVHKTECLCVMHRWSEAAGCNHTTLHILGCPEVIKFPFECCNFLSVDRMLLEVIAVLLSCCASSGAALGSSSRL